MNRLLLIIDPQMDFISGTLPVPEAVSSMEALARYIHASNGQYTAKAITMDWHPYDHCSFCDQGGPWPRHCVQHSMGAAIYPALLEALYSTHGPLHLLQKGNSPEREEYSIFRNASSAALLQRLLEEEAIEQIDLCGIAGDICVLETLKDGVERYGRALFHLLPAYTPSLDGGKALSAYLMQ